MNRNKYIAIIIVIILLLGGILYIVLTPNETAEDDRNNRTPEELFPGFDTPGGEVSQTGENDALLNSATGGEGGEFVEYIRLSNQPVVTSLVTGDVGEFGEFVHFMLRSSGHIYETTETLFSMRRLTNTTVPRIQHALISPTASHVVLQYLNNDRDSIRTFLGEITENIRLEKEETEDEDQSPYRIKGSFLPEGVTDFDFSPEGDRLFYILETGEGIEGTVLNLKNDTAQVIFQSLVNEWEVSWVADSSILLTTAPSGESDGFSYVLNPATGGFEKKIGGHRGLVTLPHPVFNTFIYSTAPSRGDINLFVHTEEGSDERLSIKTLVEKCIWSQSDTDIIYCAVPESLPDVMYPDAWYRGDVSFTDTFWRIDVSTGNERLIATPEEFDAFNIDAVDLQLTKNDTFLIFQNKKDGSLWSLRL